MTSYPSPRTPTSPQVQSPNTPGRRRVRFDGDAPNPSIRFIPPTPLSPDEIEVADFSNEPALFETPTAMHPPNRPAWAARRPSMPTTLLAFDDSDPYNRYFPDVDTDEINSRPLVIPPPPYEHVWKDIHLANSAAFRLRNALLESKRVDDVLAIIKSYPQAISARFTLHEHLTATVSAVSAAGLFPSAPGTTISSSTVPTTPALTVASVSTPGSVFTSLPGFTGATDPDFPTTALTAAHANLKETFLLFSEQFDARKEYFGRSLVLEYKERDRSAFDPRARPGFDARDRSDSRERPGSGFERERERERDRFTGYSNTPGGQHTPGGYHTPATPSSGSGYPYEEAKPNYGYPKPGDFARRDANISAKVQGNEVMLVTNGGEVEEEAMLNEDSLLCLVEDVDGACDALGENSCLCKMLRLQVKELLKFLIQHEEMVWPPPPGTVHSLGEAVIRSILVRLCQISPNESTARVADTIALLSNNLVEFARTQGFEIYNGISPSPVDPIPPRDLNNISPTPPAPAPASIPPIYTNPNSEYGRYKNSDMGNYANSERGHPTSERLYSNPNSTLSPPTKSTSPAPSASGPYVNPNRRADASGSHSPYSGSSQGGATTPSVSVANLTAMPLVRRTDPSEVLDDPNGLEDLARRGFDAVDAFMQLLRQDVATGHPDSQRFREALIYLWEMTGHYPAERDITNEVSRVSKTAVMQDAISFTHHAIWLGIQPVAVRYLRAAKSPSRIRRHLRRDIDTWRTLFHPNVHPFCSVVLPRHGAFGLVMPLAPRGNVIQHLIAHPNSDRTRFVFEAAEGLRYLHEEAKIVHGDFRGVNLLVADNGQIMVTGYGVMTAVEKNQELGFPQWSVQWGDARWMAPELHHHLNPATKFPGIRTLQSDVYAFACTALEIWTGMAPFAGHSDSSVVLEVATKGRQPPRPQIPLISKSRTDQVWSLLQACWNANPGARPTIRAILENLQVLAE